MKTDIKIPKTEDDVCFLCSKPIPGDDATYIEVLRGYVRRAHLTCGDEANAADRLAIYFNA